MNEPLSMHLNVCLAIDCQERTYLTDSHNPLIDARHGKHRATLPCLVDVIAWVTLTVHPEIDQAIALAQTGASNSTKAT